MAGRKPKITIVAEGLKSEGEKPVLGKTKTVTVKPLPKKGLAAIDKVTNAAKATQKSKKREFTPADLEIMSELEGLADYIHDAKVEIGLIRPEDVKHTFLPSAKDELDAVVEAAADATNAIMDSCEIIENVMGDISPECSDKLMDATTRIYEACSFQDITGQRITKVLKSMRHIEHRIDALLDMFGDEIVKSKRTTKSEKGIAQDEPVSESSDRVTDANLLDGPQLGDKAKKQSEIDDLLASFD